MSLGKYFKNPLRRKQYLYGLGGTVGVAMCYLMFSWVFLSTPEPTKKEAETLDVTGITGTEFTEKNTESALTSQQDELSTLSQQLKKLNDTLTTMQSSQTRVVEDIAALQANQEGMEKRTDNLENHVISANETQEKAQVSSMMRGTNGRVQPYPPSESGYAAQSSSMYSASGRMVHFSFRDKTIVKNNDTYVPATTYARAVVIGGANANASVTGTKDQKPIILKIIDDGVLPGGGHSHLRECRLISGAWGDISSETAELRLSHISCPNPLDKNSMIEEDVEGWVWYHGKEGIKGVPLMRDDKILTWAGLSGMLAGFANAAQYAQTDQSVSALGAVNTVAPSSIAAYGALGGASTAMNNLSNYYIKRAEQYHPIIQVGAGNEVTVVFEKGFFIVPHDKKNGQDAPINTSTPHGIPSNLMQEVQQKQALIQQQLHQNPGSLGRTVGVQS